MPRKLFASLAVLAGAGLAAAQMPPQPMTPAPGAAMPMDPATGAMPMGSGMGGMPMGPGMGDPAGGLFGAPTYPVPGVPPGGMCGAGGCLDGGGGLVPTWWVNTEYLLWFIQSQPVRLPYVTTSSPGDFGVIGQPTTQLLYSNGDQGLGLFSGFRIMGGWYKDVDKRCGFEFGGFLSEHKSDIYTAISDPNGVPTIARPFFQAGTGAPGVFIVSNLGLASGGIVVATNSRFWGAEGSFINNLYRSCPDDACFWNTDLLLGVRFMQLREELSFDSSSTVIGGGATFVGQPVTAGGTIIIRDSFDTTNRFYGGQLGIRTSVTYGRCVFTAVGKCAAGLMHQEISINGTTTLSDPALGINASALGGLYANAQNIGEFVRDEFSVIPEVNLYFGYNWCSWFMTYVGYTGMYVTDVVRPGDSVPLTVNSSLLPASNDFGIGAVAPVANRTLTQSDFWIQGVTFGFNVRY